MANNRVKVLNQARGSAHVDPLNLETVPSMDGFVDIDSVQTVSNKVFVNCTFSGTDPGRLSLLLWRGLFLSGWSGPMLGTAPGLVNFIQTALQTT